MVSVCYRGGYWRWLSAHERDGGGWVLTERRGACPNDQDSTFMAFAGAVEGDRMAETARAWRQQGWAAASEDERPAPVGRLRPPATPAVTPDPGDRALDVIAAEAVVEACVGAFERRFCLIANPAAAGR